MRGEYDLTQRLLAFGSADAEYDAIQDLSVRAVPKAGLGYKLYETKTDFFQVEGGGAYVYQRYFGGDTEDYFAIAFRCGNRTHAALWRTIRGAGRLSSRH